MGPGASWDLAELPDNWCCPGFGAWWLEVGSLVDCCLSWVWSGKAPQHHLLDPICAYKQLLRQLELS